MLNRDHIKEQEEMANSIHLGKFGCMRRDYLKEHRPQLYREYLESGQLVRHLLDTDEEAYERKVSLMKIMMKHEGVDIGLQERDFGTYLQKKLTIENEAERQIMYEMIYI